MKGSGNLDLQFKSNAVQRLCEFSLDHCSEFPLNMNWKSEFPVSLIDCSVLVDRRRFEEKEQ